jgi:hypothetical protein
MEQTKNVLTEVKIVTENGVYSHIRVSWRGVPLHASWRKGGREISSGRKDWHPPQIIAQGTSDGIRVAKRSVVTRKGYLVLLWISHYPWAPVANPP